MRKGTFKRKGVVTIFLCLAMLTVAMFLTVPLASAQEGQGEFIIGRDYELRSGQQVNGDLAVMGGNLVLQANSQVNGEVLVTGGNAVIGGRVRGSVVVFGGNIRLDDSAYIEGDVTSVGGRVERRPGAVVRGNLTSAERWVFPEVMRGWWSIPFSGEVSTQTLPSPVSGTAWLLGIIWNIMKAVFFAAAIGAIAVLIVLLLEKPVRVSLDAMEKQPLPSLGMGLLSIIVALAGAVLLVITICLSPAALLLTLALAIAGLFGWAIVGLYVGERVLDALGGRNVSPLLAVFGGATALCLFSQVPCIGWVIGLVVSMLGIGAAVLTRGGTTPYPPPAPVTPVASTSLEEELPLIKTDQEGPSPEACERDSDASAGDDATR